MVFPAAVHSHFEHSLGVYWLANEAVNRLQKYQGLEPGIEPIDVQTVKLAGLLHDVGHGPFSHMFGLPKVLNGIKWSHEEMSMKMVDYIVAKHNIDIDSGNLKKVKDMVVASEKSAPTGLKEKSFLYDIVANGRNSIDVDRLFETMRVIDDEICYRVKEYLTTYKVFSARSDLHRTVYMHSKVKVLVTDLHRTVYMHSKVKAIELMRVDAMIKAHDSLQIKSSYIKKPADYWKANLLLKSKKLCATSVAINYGGEDSDNKRKMQIFWSSGFCRPEDRPRFGDLWSTCPNIFTSMQDAEVEGEVLTDNEVEPIPVLFFFYNGPQHPTKNSNPRTPHYI